MEEKNLIRTNYFNHYSFRLLVGNILLTLPTLVVILLLVLWENIYFLWLAPLLGILGWFLVLPSTYTLLRPSRERVAVDALSMGFVMLICLCALLILFKRSDLIHSVDSQEVLNQISAQLDLQEKEEKYLEQLRMRIEELEGSLQQTETSERKKP